MSTPLPRHDPSHEGDSAAQLTERVQQLVAGDEAAGRWLHDSFAPRLLRRLRGRYARHRGMDVEELLQDAFLFFYQHAPVTFGRFLEEIPLEERSASRLDGYLWDLACGIASNRLRAARRRPLSFAPLAEEAADPMDGERRALDRDLLARLAACLKRAGSRAFLYYKLRFVDGFTPEEIARATGWSRKATYKLRFTLDGAIDRCARRLGLR